MISSQIPLKRKYTGCFENGTGECDQPAVRRGAEKFLPETEVVRLRPQISPSMGRASDTTENRFQS